MRAVSYLWLMIAMVLICLNANAECIAGGATRTVETKTRPLDRKVTFFGDVPEEIVVGIDWAEEESLKLKLRFTMYGKYAEYSADAIQRYESITYEPRPLTSLIANALTLGIFVVANPKRQFENFAGCADERVIEVIPDQNAKQKTEQFEWRPIDKNPIPQQLRINSLTDAFMMIPVASSDMKYIDLKEIVMSGLIAEDAEIILDCLSCNAEEGHHYSGLPLTSSKFTFKADFRVAKSQEMERVKLVRDEETKQIASERKRQQELDLEKVRKESVLQEKRKREEAELQERKRKDTVRNSLNSL